MCELLEKPNLEMSINSANNMPIPKPLQTTSSSTESSNITNTELRLTADNQPDVVESADNSRSSSLHSDQSKPAQNKVDYNVIISLVSGAIAGALAKTVIAPLDRTKINFQISKNTPYTFRAAVQYLKNIYSREGFLGLWRGNSATMARIVPYAAIQFTAHEQWRQVLHVDKNGANTKGRRFLAGSLAGITSQSLTYPLDLARARMAVTDRLTGYRTLRQVFTTIWVEEGPRTLFRGYWGTILGVIPYAGTSFFTYETLKKEYHEVTGNSKPGTLTSLAFGAAAGAAGQTSSYPLDIVRRRMQTMGVTKDTRSDQYKSYISTLVTIYKEEGIKHGFFKGLSMNWIKGPIAVGISFTTYDLIRETLMELTHLKDR